MTAKSVGLLALALTSALGACQTSPAKPSGYLTRYDGMAAPGQSLRASVSQRRDDAASDAVRQVYLTPAEAVPGVGAVLDPVERSMVLREVDRQICYEVSERFDIVSQPSPQAATVRTAVVRIQPTGRVGSAASAAAGFFVPIVKLRAPMSTGGLAVESEMLAAGTGEQIAAVSWARSAQVVGLDAPSLSRVGDALQLAEPLGDAVGNAFSSKARPVRAIPAPDPCAAYGPRRDLARTAGGMLVGAATGLYSPEVAGTGAKAEPAPAPR